MVAAIQQPIVTHTEARPEQQPQRQTTVVVRLPRLETLTEALQEQPLQAQTMVEAQPQPIVTSMAVF